MDVTIWNREANGAKAPRAAVHHYTYDDKDPITTLNLYFDQVEHGTLERVVIYIDSPEAAMQIGAAILESASRVALQHIGEKEDRGTVIPVAFAAVS